jgi:hypothetical protein
MVFPRKWREEIPPGKTVAIKANLSVRYLESNLRPLGNPSLGRHLRELVLLTFRQESRPPVKAGAARAAAPRPLSTPRASRRSGPRGRQAPGGAEGRAPLWRAYKARAFEPDVCLGVHLRRDRFRG